MTNSALETGTWYRKSGLATWQYRVSMADDAHATDSLCDAAARAWAVLDGFADVASAAWTSLSRGEDDRVEAQPVLDSQRLRSTCKEVGDACTLDLYLDLRCIALDGTEGTVERGAKLVFDLDWPDPTDLGVGKPELDVVLRLNADIHAARTGAVNPDNRALAALNGPRLTAFLRRLRSELGATLVDFDAYAGPNAVDADGWVNA